ncbi:glycosyltransferase family 8 protein [Lysinibacillus parviboronicapiens]|uniref:glycosyltransferase family 8 protein n=1 Tax=Lysinibacillus parviboronicapiens TaxID=436516 RepID=UPI00187D37C1|nr:glycosyltransferase family 8 protein [Lysinibacillus parviboronicapiens]
MKKIYLAVAFEREYIQHFTVLLNSLIENNRSLNTYEIYILHSDLTKEDFELLNLFKDEYIYFNFFDMTIFDFSNVFISGHISKETYYRILLAEIIPPNIDKVLYLDCDIVINEDLEEIWNFELNGYSAAGVIDFNGHHRKIELEIPDAYKYINAGVLLINLYYWREKNVENEILQFINNNTEKLMYWDQDAINAVLYHSLRILPYKWNVQNSSFTINNVSGELAEAKISPAIIHFTGSVKPWHISCSNPFQNLYYKYLDLEIFSANKISVQTEKLLNTKKDIYIWGAGQTGRKVLDYLQIEIEAFIDSDKSKINSYLLGKPIISIETIPNKKDSGIIICSGFYKEIRDILVGFGYVEYKDFTYQL